MGNEAGCVGRVPGVCERPKLIDGVEAFHAAFVRGQIVPAPPEYVELIRRELDVARELACDEGMVELSAARTAYARTLRDVAGFSAGLSHAAPAASMSLAGGRSLMLRVTRTLALAKRKC